MYSVCLYVCADLCMYEYHVFNMFMWKKSEAEMFMSQVRKEEGKFVELPGAEMGKVVTRFPPEASGWGMRASC